MTPAKNWMPISAVPSCAYVMVTPELARQWLLVNTRNRDPKANVIERYQDAIANDLWMATPHGVGFDTDGCLVDGQHRLMAIVASGQSAVILVAWGLDPHVINVLDDGSKRRASDAMKIDGVDRASDVATIVLGICKVATGRNDAFSNLVVSMAYEKNRTEVDWMIDLTAKSGQFKRFPQFVAGALCIAHRKHPAQVNRLAWEVWTGEEIRARTPAQALSRYLKPENAKKEMHRHKAASITFAACWHQLQNTRVSQLKEHQAAYEYFVGDSLEFLP